MTSAKLINPEKGLLKKFTVEIDLTDATDGEVRHMLREIERENRFDGIVLDVWLRDIISIIKG